MIRIAISRRSVSAIILTLAATVAPGCTSIKSTGTARSGTEQLLLTGAFDRALCGVDFSPLAGRRAYLDSQYISGTDKDWMLFSIRRAMAEQGVLLEGSKDKADVIVEAAVGAYGTDERNCMFGLPSQVSLIPIGFGGIPGAASGASTTSSSALTLSQTNKQDAVVKTALFAYDAKQGYLIWESGQLLNAEGIRDHYAVGSGPFRRSSLTEVEEYPQEARAGTRHRLLSH
jgi:hypothetical protein